jgi:hypothetical protein
VDRSGCPHGMGRFTDDEQHIEYLGEWRAGHWHGWGKLVQANGDVLEGQWDRGVFSGEGRLSQTEGGIYDGETLLFLSDSSSSTRSSLTLVVGCWFLLGAAGQWQYNRPCGEGRYVLPDGTVYSVSQPVQCTTLFLPGTFIQTLTSSTYVGYRCRAYGAESGTSQTPLSPRNPQAAQVGLHPPHHTLPTTRPRSHVSIFLIFWNHSDAFSVTPSRVAKVGHRGRRRERGDGRAGG